MKIILKITVLSAIIICGLTLFTSCHHKLVYHGYATIIERSFDRSLEDSVIIHGYVIVLEISGEQRPPYWYERATIKIIETEVTVQNNDDGYFSIKILPGIYTIECIFPSTPQNGNPSLRNIEVFQNEIIKIKFIKERVH